MTIVREEQETITNMVRCINLQGELYVKERLLRLSKMRMSYLHLNIRILYQLVGHDNNGNPVPATMNRGDLKKWTGRCESRIAEIDAEIEELGS